ncbi:MAG TPA: ABC transporter substrate-binding protein, partial [Chloroflexota bacterium]
MNWKQLVVLGALLSGAATACAGPAAQPGQASTTASTKHILSMATRVEPAFVAGRGLTPTGLTLTTSLRLFNAGLVILDGGGTIQPYLSENVPALNTDTWQVFPDGRMETTYRLRSGLTWHDGTPLTANDMVFALQVFGTPAFGLAQLPPEGQIGEIVAQDERTILIRWSRLFPKADQLQYGNLAPMPRHLLEQQLQSLDPNTFLSLPFWTVEYVGAGPFRLDHWESGAYFDVSAFDGHALGRPQIDRIHVTFIGDANTALANLLSGEVSLVVDD